MTQAVVLCPLEIERRAAARALKDVGARIEPTGPGADAIRAAIAKIPRGSTSLVVLFGLAGGLRQCELSPRIGWVMDKDARAWTIPCIAPGADDPVGVVGVDEPVTTPARKRRMGEAYGAALVDCESHAFAEACTTAGLRWAVVRGVCDGVDQSLPAAASEWVDAKGRTRIGRVLLSIMLRPGVVFGVIMLGRRAKPGLKSAALRLAELIKADAVNPKATTVQIQVPVRQTVAPGVGSTDERFSNPIEMQLGRRSARTNDPLAKAAPPQPPRSHRPRAS